jgi:hypothetical protein
MQQKSNPLSRIFHLPFSPGIGLMNLLNFPLKFGLISLLFALPLALVLVLFVLQTNTTISLTQKERYGTAYLRPLRALYEAVLQDKIIEQAFQNGAIPANSLDTNRVELDRGLGELERADQAYGGLLETQPKFQPVRTTRESAVSRFDPRPISSINSSAIFMRSTRRLEIIRISSSIPSSTVIISSMCFSSICRTVKT